MGKEKGRRQPIETLKLLCLARDEMDRRYSERLDIAECAQITHMSAAHFAREFRAAYGETPHAYLQTRRIERAMVLLQGGATVTEACMAAGCSSLGSFSSSFTGLVGETPSAYRKSHSGGSDEISPCLAVSEPRTGQSLL